MFSCIPVYIADSRLQKSTATAFTNSWRLYIFLGQIQAAEDKPGMAHELPTLLNSSEATNPKVNQAWFDLKP